MEEPRSLPTDPEMLRPLMQDGSFEETLRALEIVVDLLERGQISLDETVHWYEIGLGLSRRCQTLLDEAALRVSTLEDTTE